ncbi:hypothetical protein [Lacrimispora sp.]|uniref:hypothetical protein n=1 Tax=Lacrimispora sp. TaxID=2719234 RepID=UPI0028A58F3A|nr:hypothetical protein [Lacrimispora sp.]
MVFENYSIKNVSVEDSFLGELIEKMYWLGSNDGFILGELYGIIKKMQGEDGLTPEELEVFYKGLESLLGEYSALHSFVAEEWRRRGKPKSLRQQESETRTADEGNRYKAEYCDR